MWSQVEPSLLNHLPHGGAVAAVIAVVVLFLKEQARSHDAIKMIVASFAAETAAARKDYREHVDAIMSLGLDAHRETREAVRALDATLAGKDPAAKVKEAPR